MARSDKRQRQNLIRKIISERDVFSQEDLRSELLRRSVDTTQATLSRDISELGLVKSSSSGTYQLPESVADRGDDAPALLEHLRRLIRDVDHSGNLVLIKTAPGDAQAAGERFDHLNFEEVAGTLAGDDTLLVVVREKWSASRFAQKLRKLVGETG
jgi:transcriptional regulator of arginine metabolism